MKAIVTILFCLVLFSCDKDTFDKTGLEMEWVSIHDNLTFTMGDSFSQEPDSATLPHKITLSPYRIGKYEISNRQYCQFMNEALAAGKLIYSENFRFNGVPAKGVGSLKGDTLYYHINDTRKYYHIRYTDGKFVVKEGYDDFPIVVVTWHGANAFAKFYGLKLPTEAQWERAARGPDPGRKFPWGNEIPDCSYANFGYNSEGNPLHCCDSSQITYSYPKGKSTEGCYNMAGNVYEYCSDFYDNYYYLISPSKNPEGPDSGTYHVMRGGSMYDNPLQLSTFYRNRIVYYDRHSNIGFRVVQNGKKE